MLRNDYNLEEIAYKFPLQITIDKKIIISKILIGSMQLVKKFSTVDP